MKRLGCLIPIVLAGCSTAPVAGLMDAIDGHHRGRSDRDTPRPPPEPFEPVRKARVSDPSVEPAPAEPYDMPAEPARRRKEKVFEPKDKVRPVPARTASDTRESDADHDSDRPRERKTPPPSDERDDF